MTIEVRCSNGHTLPVMDEWASKSGVSPQCHTRMAKSSNAGRLKGENAKETATRKAYRVAIESLLDASEDERLCVLWKQVYHFPIDPAYPLPNRSGIIEDVADFAEVLQPSLEGMKSDQLCRLIERYAAYSFRHPLR